MKEFYHVDRRQTLEEDQTLQLIENPVERFAEIFGNLPDYKGALDKHNIIQLIDNEFPQGLSMHGLRYVIGRPELWNNTKSEILQTRSAFYIEHMYEQIRKNEFSDKNSRLQSWFAFENKTQACNFPDSSNAPFDVYRVESEKSLKMDMNLLKYGSYGKVLRKGKRYWKGERSKLSKIEVVMQPPIKVIEKVETVPTPK